MNVVKLAVMGNGGAQLVVRVLILLREQAIAAMGKSLIPQPLVALAAMQVEGLFVSSFKKDYKKKGGAERRPLFFILELDRPAGYCPDVLTVCVACSAHPEGRTLACLLIADAQAWHHLTA